MAAAGLRCCCCCKLSSPPAQSFESMAARLAPTHHRRGAASFNAAISAGLLLKPLSSSLLWSTNSFSSPSSRSLWALSNVGPGAPRRTYSREGDGGRPNRMVAEVYSEHNGGPPQQREQEQERDPLPRPRVIPWDKDFGSANSVQLIGRVGRDIEIKYLDSGKVVATTTLSVSKSQRTGDLSWFTLEIWDDLAETAAQHVAKGELLSVAGKIVVDKTVKDDSGYSIAKVVVRDFCFVDPSSEPRQAYGRSNDEFTVRGSSRQPQAEHMKPWRPSKK